MPDTEKVTILIDGIEFSAWPAVSITLHLDSVATVAFTAPFLADRLDFRELFRPFTYKPVEIKVDDNTIFLGTMVGVAPDSDTSKSIVNVTCYSLPGVLMDCNAPAFAVPIEFKGIDLVEISKALAEAFDLGLDFRESAGAVFDKVKLDVDRGIFDFLSSLARQRNLVWSSTAEGDLLCWKSVSTGSPVARLKEGEQPVTGVAGSFGPQGYFSEITGFVAAKKGRKGSKYTEQNSRLTDVLRPMSFKLGDTEDAGGAEATKAKMGRMFANVASYEVDVATWRDPNDKLWAPNTTLTLDAPNAMVYTESELLIRTVTLHQDSKSTTAKLGLVLPGAFSGEIPETLPWDG